MSDERRDLQVQIDVAEVAPARPRRRAILYLGVAALLALTGWSAWAVIARDAAPSATPASTPDPTDGVDRFAENALRLLGPDPSWDPPAQYAFSGVVTATPARHTFGAGDTPFPAGLYRVSVVCVGEGTIAVTWQSPTAEPDGGFDSRNVGCDPEGGFDGGEIILDEPGEIRFTVADRDPSAAGRSAFAVTVTDPLAVTALDALGAPAESELLRTQGSAAGRTTITSSVAAGSYRFTVVGVGTQAVPFVIRLGEEPVLEHLICSPTGNRLEVTLRTEVPAELAIDIVGVQGGAPQCGFALYVEPLP